MRKGMLVGLLLLVIGATLFLWSLVKTNVDTVIDVSFTVDSGTKYEPYDGSGIYYHTRVLSKSALSGEVFVQGEGIYLTVIGYNTQGLSDVYVETHYGFKIDPADDLYTFNFDNTQGATESIIRFILKEEWTPLAAVSRAIGLYLLLPAGLILVLMSCLKARRKS